MQKRLLMTAGFLFLFALPVFAQVPPNCSTPEKLSDEEKERCIESAERTNGILAGTRFFKPAADLMPGASNAWILHLITTGGYTGGGLPTITVSSGGKYACGEGNPLNFKSLSGDSFETLSELITTSNFNVEKGQKKSDETSGVYMCNDCFVATLSIARRESSNKVSIYRNPSQLSKYQRIAEQFDSIRKAVENLGVCR